MTAPDPEKESQPGSSRRPIWREVANETTHSNPGWEKSWAVGGNRMLVLSCGHESWRKKSQAVPKKVRCRECERLRSGGRETLTLPDGRQVITTWDEETQMPRREHKQEPREEAPAPDQRTVSLPLQLAQEVLEELHELLGERAWWKDEPRCGYQERYEALRRTADELSAVVSMEGENPPD